MSPTNTAELMRVRLGVDSSWREGKQRNHPTEDGPHPPWVGATREGRVLQPGANITKTSIMCVEKTSQTFLPVQRYDSMVLATAWCLSPSQLSVLSKWLTELVFGMEASFNLSYAVI